MFFIIKILCFLNIDNVIALQSLTSIEPLQPAAGSQFVALSNSIKTVILSSFGHNLDKSIKNSALKHVRASPESKFHV